MEVGSTGKNLENHSVSTKQKFQTCDEFSEYEFIDEKYR